MKCHPVTAAVGMFLLGPINYAMTVLTIRAMPIPVFSALVQWRSWAFVVPSIMFSVVLGWLLVRTRPKAVMVSRV
ncbi:MAG: hypothetical protein ACLQVY_18335 [Limisphaerales bacterium]